MGALSLLTLARAISELVLLAANSNLRPSDLVEMRGDRKHKEQLPQPLMQ